MCYPVSSPCVTNAATELRGYLSAVRSAVASIAGKRKDWCVSMAQPVLGKKRWVSSYVPQAAKARLKSLLGSIGHAALRQGAKRAFKGQGVVYECHYRMVVVI